MFKIISAAIFILILLFFRKRIISLSMIKQLIVCISLLIAFSLIPVFIWLVSYAGFSYSREMRFSSQFIGRYIYNPLSYGPCCYDGPNPNIKACLPVNADGLIADREYLIPKKNGVYRIALIGDSFAAGFGLEYKDTLGKKLEKHLGCGAEVINFAFSGSNTDRQEKNFLHKGKKYSPNLIIIRYRLDDILPTEELYYETVTYAISNKWSLLPGKLNDAVLRREIFAIRKKYEKYFRNHEKECLERNIIRPFDALNKYISMNNADAMILLENCLPEYGAVCRTVKDISRKYGWYLFVLNDDKNIDFSDPRMHIENDGHPTAYANEIIAREIQKYMLKYNIGVGKRGSNPICAFLGPCTRFFATGTFCAGIKLAH